MQHTIQHTIFRALLTIPYSCSDLYLIAWFRVCSWVCESSLGSWSHHGVLGVEVDLCGIACCLLEPALVRRASIRRAQSRIPLDLLRAHASVALHAVEIFAVARALHRLRPAVPAAEMPAPHTAARSTVQAWCELTPEGSRWISHVLRVSVVGLDTRVHAPNFSDLADPFDRSSLQPTDSVMRCICERITDTSLRVALRSTLLHALNPLDQTRVLQCPEQHEPRVPPVSFHAGCARCAHHAVRAESTAG
eukprot:1237784-Rhodomonas_salina.2